MRIPLSTDLKTRTGVSAGKDARMVNSYVETRGDQSVVRKRPIAQGGVSVGSGTAQGGIGFSMGGTEYIYTFNGDVGALDTLASAGTSWSSSSTYASGSHVSYGFEDYFAVFPTDSSNPQNPTDAGSIYWSQSPSGCVSSSSFPASRVTGTSTQTYDTAPTVPDPFIHSDEIIGRYCFGELHHIVETTYSLTYNPADVIYKSVGPSDDGTGRAITSFAASEEAAALAFYAAYTWKTCSGMPVYYFWLEEPHTFFGSYPSSRYASWHYWTAADGNCGVAVDNGYGGGCTITQVTGAYYLTATTTDYYEVQ